MSDINNKSPIVTNPSILEFPYLLYNGQVNSYADSQYVLTTAYLTVAVVVLLLAQFLFYSKNKKTQKSLDENNDEKKILGLDDIPGPKPVLGIKFVGSIPKMLPYSQSLKQGLKWFKEYPAIGKATGAGKTFVGLNNGPMVQQLLKSVDFGHGSKSPVTYGPMKPFIKNGVLVSFGKFWYGQRKILMRSQSWQSLKAYMGMLNKYSEQFADRLEKLFEDGKSHQINEEINILFLKVITEMITGFNVEDSPEFNQYHHNFQIWKSSLVLRVLHPWLLLKPIWRLHPGSKTLDKAVDDMFDYAKRRIVEHKERRSRGDDEKSPFRSVLDEVLDADMDDDQIVDEVNTMIFGGHETGASAIHSFCFCMALNPEIQERCREEIDEMFENPDCFKNGQITYEALGSHFRYTERCINETLRILPPVFMFVRELTSPLRVEHEDKTYEIPTGVNIIVCPFAMQRDPVVFPEPEKFDPDRFLPEEVAKRHAYSFIPFSAGQRDCLGRKFGMMEMKAVVAFLLRRFVIRTTDKFGDIPLLPFITLTPETDYTFQFTKREITPKTPSETT